MVQTIYDVCITSMVTVRENYFYSVYYNYRKLTQMSAHGKRILLWFCDK